MADLNVVFQLSVWASSSIMVSDCPASLSAGINVLKGVRLISACAVKMIVIFVILQLSKICRAPKLGLSMTGVMPNDCNAKNRLMGWCCWAVKYHRPEGEVLAVSGCE